MRRRAAARGFTLVEMMVALALGLAVVAALIAAWLVLFASGRRTEAMLQVTEDATLALDVMRQQVAQAGFGQPHGGGSGGFVMHAFPALAGCRDANFADPQAAIDASANCQAARTAATSSDALEVAYEASMLGGGSANAILGGPGDQPLDCLGNSFPKVHDGATGDDYWRVDSKFYVADGSLWCKGPGNAAAAAVAQNIEALRVTYGLAAVPGGGQVAYDDAAPPAGSPLWAGVVSVHLCVQVRSAAQVLDRAAAATLGRWVDCRDAASVSVDGYLRRTFATTIALHNRLPP